MRGSTRTYTVVGVFALIFIAGIAYAMAAGTLNLNDNMDNNKKTHLRIIDEKITNKAEGERVDVSGDGDMLTFTVHLTKPGETKHVSFKIENTGDKDVILETLVVASPEPNKGIKVSLPELNNVVVPKKSKMPTTSEYKLAVTWDAAHEGNAGAPTGNGGTHTGNAGTPTGNTGTHTGNNGTHADGKQEVTLTAKINYKEHTNNGKQIKNGR